MIQSNYSWSKHFNSSEKRNPFQSTETSSTSNISFALGGILLKLWVKEKPAGVNTSRLLHASMSAQKKDTWNQGVLFFHTPTRVQSPISPFRPCSWSAGPHPTGKRSLGEHVWLTSVWNMRRISTHSADDSPQPDFETQRLRLFFLSRRCGGNICPVLSKRELHLGRQETKTSGSVLTCRDIGVKHGAVLQGPSVPAAHSVSFLWEICLVALLQHGLGVLGWTLWRSQQDSAQTASEAKNHPSTTGRTSTVPHPPLPLWLLLASLRFWQLSPARLLPQPVPCL